MPLGSEGEFGRPSNREIVLLEQDGIWGGPTYRYRGCQIWTNQAGDLWQVWIENHPLRGLSLRSMDRAVTIVDCWLDHAKLP